MGPISNPVGTFVNVLMDGAIVFFWDTANSPGRKSARSWHKKKKKKECHRDRALVVQPLERDLHLPERRYLGAVIDDVRPILKNKKRTVLIKDLFWTSSFTAVSPTFFAYG